MADRTDRTDRDSRELAPAGASCPSTSLLERQAYKTSAPAPIYVIFAWKRRTPSLFVVRRFTDTPDPEPLAVVETIDAARAAIQSAAPDARCYGRDRLDDPAIEEIWQ